MIKIFTDGACNKNKQGSFGVIVYDNNKIIDCFQHSENNTTNNIMEMKAILYAIIKYHKLNPVIYSDSAYAINSFTIWRHTWKENGWVKYDGKEIKNLELIKLYDELINMGYTFQLQKVKGHSNCEENILADKLATKQLTITEIMRKI